MKITDFFQKGYYLNLDRRADRKVQFEGEMKRVGLQNFFERVPSIDGINESDPMARHGYCGATFHKLYQKIKEDKTERFLIMEDDALFYDGGNEPAQQIIEKALDQLQQFPKWDMIYFGGYIFDKPTIQVSENLLKPNVVLTMHAVGYNRSFLDKILPYVPFKDCAIDGWIGDRRYITKYFVYPMAVIQRNSPSDLDAMGWAPEILRWIASYNAIQIAK